MQFTGTLYRALNPYWAYRPLSGEGAKRLGGRFNVIGRPALYLAFSIETALNEVNQAGLFMPTTLVAIKVDLDPVLDATDPGELARFGRAPTDLAIPDWSIRMEDEGIAPTQRLAEEVIAAGYCAMQVPSFAPGAAPGACNMVLWRWGGDLPHKVQIIDDEDRLRHPPAPPLQDRGGGAGGRWVQQL